MWLLVGWHGVVGMGFDIFAIKEPYYKIMLMSTYEKLVVSEEHKENVRMVNFLNTNGTGTCK